MKIPIKITEADLQEANKLKSIPYTEFPVNHSPFNFMVYGIWAVYMSEVRRNLRVWIQNIFSPFVNAVLYFLIFGTILGASLPDINGLPYIMFLVPGFLVSPMSMAAFGNGAFVMFNKIYFNSIQTIQMSPLKANGFLISLSMASVTRASIVSVVIWLASLIFTHSISIAHPFLLLFLIIIVTTLFSLLGNLNGLFARSFEEINFVPTFILQPLLYISGIFFEVSKLPWFFAKLSLLNPLTYIVSTIRYAFNGGEPEYNVTVAIIILLSVTIVLYLTVLRQIRKRINLQ